MVPHEKTNNQRQLLKKKKNYEFWKQLNVYNVHTYITVDQLC